MGKPTFYTAFANSVNEDEFLPNLSEEAMKIADLLQKLAFDDKLYYVKDEIFNLDRLVMNFSKYGDRFDIFYFSGHGKEGCLKLTDNFTAGLMPMANVINRTLKNLKLGFFNACETFNLAKEVALSRARTTSTDKLVMIACRSEINTYLAERFATLFFTQIGQPGTYKDAYDQAKALVCLMNDKVRFREFYELEELEEAGDDFDYAYMELSYAEQKNTSGGKRRNANDPKKKEGRPTSIIGNDEMVSDALTTNYINEVVKTFSDSKVEAKQVEILSNALEAAQQATGDKKSNGKLDKIFKKAADELPGFNSPNAFKSLINVENHRDNPIVQKIVKTEQNTAIGSMVDLVNKIRF